MPGQDEIARRTMITEAAVEADATQDGKAMRLGPKQRDLIRETESRHARGSRGEFTADLRRLVRLRIEGVNVTHAAVQKQHDARFGPRSIRGVSGKPGMIANDPRKCDQPPAVQQLPSSWTIAGRHWARLLRNGATMLAGIAGAVKGEQVKFRRSGDGS